MNAEIATRKEGEVLRPLKVLVPLIKMDLEQAEEASKQAGMPYYKAAGEKMNEARGPEGRERMTLPELYAWTNRNFQIGKTQTRLYMSYAATPEPSARRGEEPFTSLDDFQRRHLGRDRRPGGGHHRDWTAPIDDIADRARREQERIREQELTRQEERQAEHTLALRLIEIGYKVLAKELHPDKGGSRDAMSRLNRVRDRLKGHA